MAGEPPVAGEPLAPPLVVPGLPANDAEPAWAGAPPLIALPPAVAPPWASDPPWFVAPPLGSGVLEEESHPNKTNEQKLTSEMIELAERRGIVVETNMRI